MERFRRLVESSPDGIVVIENEQIAYANAAAVELIGVASADQLTGRWFVELPDRDSKAPVRERLRSWERGESGPLDVKINRPDGATRDVSLSGAPLQDDEPRAIQVVMRDITERKQSEQRLRESEERLALAMAGGLEGVWDWNLETDAVVYSSRWKQMLGYADDEIEPHLSAWERLVHPDDRSRADAAYELARGTRATYEAEFRLRHKEGHYVHVLSRGFPVRREPGGPVVRIVGTHLDLTEQKRAEAALRENEERLKLAFAGAQEGVWDWNLETTVGPHAPSQGSDRSDGAQAALHPDAPIWALVPPCPPAGNPLVERNPPGTGSNTCPRETGKWV
jgi:PAS domain S-box-containing protein